MDKERDFIFPMNYKSKEKFLGLIDYKTLAAIACLAILTFFILKGLEMKVAVKVSIFIIIVGFFTILILVGVNGENMLDFLYFIIKYLINEKIYVYRKTDDKEDYGICERLLKHGFKLKILKKELLK